jgi:hypothetical protein
LITEFSLKSQLAAGSLPKSRSIFQAAGVPANLPAVGSRASVKGNLGIQSLQGKCHICTLANLSSTACFIT